MRSFVSIVTARLGNFFHFRWLFRWRESSGALPLPMMAGSLFSLLCWGLSHYGPQLMHAFPPLLAEFRGALPSHQSSEWICAPFGGERAIRLKDGTRVELDSGACILPELSATKRLITLESGEAVFQVARDPVRPFVVETGPLAIRALGTQFDVYRRELTTRVSVIEGSVQVSSADKASPMSTDPLTALQQMDVPDDTARPRVRRPITEDDVMRITAWVHGYVEFKDQTLREGFEEFERYQHIQVEFIDPHISEMPIGGRFRTKDMEEFLDLLKLEGIHSDYDKDRQRITLSWERGKHVGFPTKQLPAGQARLH